jgi:hypothetical protein
VIMLVLIMIDTKLSKASNLLNPMNQKEFLVPL